MRVFVLRTTDQLDRLLAFLRDTWEAQADTDAPLEVTVGVWKEQRSNAQNARYWAILTEIANQVTVKGKRYDTESWHEFFKRKFIGYQELPTGGMVGLSSATLSTEDFSAYMTQVEAHAVSELGVIFEEAIA